MQTPEQAAKFAFLDAAIKAAVNHFEPGSAEEARQAVSVGCARAVQYAIDGLTAEVAKVATEARAHRIASQRIATALETLVKREVTHAA